MATTGGQAGWNLCGRSAAGLASSRFGCGGREASFLGVASDSASLWLGNHACAPPLLQRIGVVGGAVVTLRRVMLSGGVEGTKESVVGKQVHRGERIVICTES